jgi:hypothetical protein
VETQTVSSDEHGSYSVLLGASSATGLPLDVFTSGKALWLGVEPQLPGVGEQARVLLVAVPYALKAADADTLGGKPASVYVTTETRAGTSLSSQGSGIVTPANSQTATQNSGEGVHSAANRSGLVSISGSGNTNYIPIWTNSTTLGNSGFYQVTAGNVGLGTTNPGAKLEVDTAAATAAVSGIATNFSTSAIGVAGTGLLRGVVGTSTSTTPSGFSRYGVLGTAVSTNGAEWSARHPPMGLLEPRRALVSASTARRGEARAKACGARALRPNSVPAWAPTACTG